METRINLKPELAEIIFHNMLQLYWLYTKLKPPGVEYTIGPDTDDIYKVAISFVGNYPDSSKHIFIDRKSCTLTVRNYVEDEKMHGVIQELLSPLNISLTEKTDIAKGIGMRETEIPVSSVKVIPVKRDDNLHIFSNYTIFKEVDYCGRKVMTGPLAFNAAIDLRRDTSNQELVSCGIMSGKDKFIGPVKISSIVFFDRSINCQTTVELPDPRESDCVMVNDWAYNLSYGMEIFDLPPGDPTVRYFEVMVKGCKVKFTVSMYGVVDLNQGICLIDTDGSFDGVGFDIYGINGEDDGVVHYETDKHKEVREHIRTNFKLIGYNLEVKRTLQMKVDPAKEFDCTFKSEIDVKFVSGVNGPTRWGPGVGEDGLKLPFHDLSGGAIDVLNKLVKEGPLDDGDLPSKSGMMELVAQGLAVKDYAYKLPNIVTDKGRFLQRPSRMKDNNEQK